MVQVDPQMFRILWYGYASVDFSSSSMRQIKDLLIWTCLTWVFQIEHNVWQSLPLDSWRQALVLISPFLRNTSQRSVIKTFDKGFYLQGQIIFSAYMRSEFKEGKKKRATKTTTNTHFELTDLQDQHWNPL